MKSRFQPTGIVFALFLLFIFSEVFGPYAAAGENQCFTCHTNPRKLIQITREIAESNKGQPAKSSKIEGEG